MAPKAEPKDDSVPADKAAAPATSSAGADSKEATETAILRQKKCE